MIDKTVGMFTGLLAGYFLGMIIGFTVFDPNWDVWALLGAVLAVAGLGVGLLPRFRRNKTVILGALLGFYLGTLLRVPLFGVEDEFDLLENGIGSLICSLGGTLLGAWLGARYHSPALAYSLFAALWGGFVGGLLLGMAIDLGLEQSFTGMAPLVLACAVVLGGLAWFIQRGVPAARA